MRYLPNESTLALILAGGNGTRLGDLTRTECKPALPFGGKYRNIDFSLLPAGTVIGRDRELDARRFHVSEAGVVLVTQATLAESVRMVA